MELKHCSHDLLKSIMKWGSQQALGLSSSVCSIGPPMIEDLAPFTWLHYTMKHDNLLDPWVWGSLCAIIGPPMVENLTSTVMYLLAFIGLRLASILFH